MKTKTMARGLLVVISLVLVAMMMVTLTSCGGSKEDTIDTSWTANDENAVIYFSRILPLSAEAREMFVAASRGYNMAQEGFDKNADAPALAEVSLDGAKAALDKIKPTDDASVVEAAGHSITLTKGSPNNIKITHSIDLLIAEEILKNE